jgi:transposase, IS5 family
MCEKGQVEVETEKKSSREIRKKRAKEYLKIAKNRRSTKKQRSKAIKKQLQYINFPIVFI